MSNRERFDKYFGYIERPGKDKLLEYLENSGYFKAPSSSAYHGAAPEGNLEHSLNVTDAALLVKKALDCKYDTGITDESIIICGLFHDLGKADYYEKPQYVPNILKGGKQSDSKPYTHNDERLNIPHEISSLHILSKFIPLTEDETFAILMHNGLYTGLGTTALKGNERKLQQIIHFSDMYASRFIEAEEMTLDNILF